MRHKPWNREATVVDTKLLVVAKVPSALEIRPPTELGTNHKKNKKAKLCMHFVLAHYPPKKHSVHLFFLYLIEEYFPNCLCIFTIFHGRGKKDTSLQAFFMAHGLNALTF